MLKLLNAIKSSVSKCCGSLSIPNNHPKITRNVTSSVYRKSSSKTFTMGSHRWESPDIFPVVAGMECIVMSYNVLAQDLIEKHPYLYTRHLQDSLRWDQRFQRLIKNISDVHPAILCLQEVQKSHIPQYVKGLRKLNLTDHIYKKRTSVECTDGCAIFYNSKVLELIDSHQIEFFRPDVQILNRPNIAIIAKFRSMAKPNVVFLVATTHLLYNPKRDDVRLAQIQLLLAEIDRLAYLRHHNNQAIYAPIILTGDFNLQPSSAAYSLLTQGSLQYDATNGKCILPLSMGITDDCKHSQQQSGSTKKTEKDMSSFQTGKLNHKLNLTSTYEHAWTATTYQNEFVTVDYIFYSRAFDAPNNVMRDDRLILIGTYALPNIAFWQYVMGSIPNRTFGSDHVPLAAKFIITETNNL